MVSLYATRSLQVPGSLLAFRPVIEQAISMAAEGEHAMYTQTSSIAAEISMKIKLAGFNAIGIRSYTQNRPNVGDTGRQSQKDAVGESEIGKGRGEGLDVWSKVCSLRSDTVSDAMQYKLNVITHYAS